MTDDLRTRIAKVLHDIYGNMLRDEDREWGDEPHMIRDDYLRDADAVIRELGLTQQYLFDGIISDGEPRPWEVPYETRYVTEWVADE